MCYLIKSFSDNLDYCEIMSKLSENFRHSPALSDHKHNSKNLSDNFATFHVM